MHLLRHSLILLGLVVALTGCGDGRYQLVHSPSSTGQRILYRIDTRTGEVVMISGLYMFKVNSLEETEKLQRVQDPQKDK
jgi:hypothetical protein